MKHCTAFALLAALPLCGCVEMLKSRALTDADEKCAAQGKQFVLDDITQKTGVFDPIWSVQVVGRCVGPEDPQYKPPA